MTKKDFELIASCLYGACRRLPRHGREENNRFCLIVEEFCRTLQRTNERFDSHKFRDAVYCYEAEAAKFIKE